MKKLCFILLILLSLTSFAQQVNIKGTVVSRDDKTPVPAVDIVVKTDGGQLFTVTTDKDGHYVFVLDWNKCKKAQFYPQPNRDVKTPTAPYGFMATEKKYEVAYTDSAKGSFDFELIRVLSCGGPNFQMLFKYNTSSLVDSVSLTKYYDDNKVEYYNPLNDVDGLYKTLEGNPTIVIEVSGHCSSDEKKVSALSKKRAKYIKKLLVKKGIPSKRIVARGFGIKKLKIRDEQIEKATTKEEKEKLAEMNRRVVFRILNWDYKSSKTPEPKYHPKAQSEEGTESDK